MTSTICKKEILMDILLRLPAKTLIRFLCACKSWSDMINNPDFVSANLNSNFTKHRNMHLLCLCKLLDDKDEPEYDQPLKWFFFHYETFERGLMLSHPSGSTELYGIYGSSNGLVCVSHYEPDLSCRSPIIIWNPSIRKFKTLPSSTNNKFRYMSLQFGFHPKDNDYKVVRMIWLNKDVFAVEVYSLSTNSWKLIEEIPPWLKYDFKHHKGTFINGVAYRILEKHYMYTVMSFDSATGEFEEFIVPESIINSYNLHLYYFEEKLCLMSHWYCSDEEEWERDELWVLEDQRWKRWHPFYYPKNGYHSMGIIDDNVLMQKNDYRYGVVDLFMVNYETREEIITGIKLAYTRIKYEDLFYVFPYTESLVLLN